MMTLDTLRAAVDRGDAFDYLLFYGHTPRPDGTVSAACMSQWYAAGFELDGHYYPTAEHYMMAGKARLFGDDDMLEAIWAAPGPAQAKQLGRKVRHFDDRRWKSERRAIVVAGNLGKFGQNPALRDFLLATGDQVLVEASPRDRIWGIGMGRTNPDASDPRRWRGQNLLGFALMEVREALRGPR